VHKTSSEPIIPENISINLQLEPKQSEIKETLNSMALSILWAHFEACRQGLLDEDLSVPWEKIPEDGTSPEETQWVFFLKSMIIDATWVEWLKDPMEVRRRSMAAYRHMKRE
jgi:hypothetical protein